MPVYFLRGFFENNSSLKTRVAFIFNFLAVSAMRGERSCAGVTMINEVIPSLCAQDERILQSPRESLISLANTFLEYNFGRNTMVKTVKFRKQDTLVHKLHPDICIFFWHQGPIEMFSGAHPLVSYSL